MSKWGELAESIEHAIEEGRLQPGDLLPSVKDQMSRTGFSRPTVLAAYGDLRARGLVTGEPGKRCQVTGRALLEVHVTRDASRVAGGQEPTRGADSWEHDAAEHGHAATGRLSVRAGAAGPLAGRLWAHPETPVIVREVLRYADGRPHNLATWTFPRQVAEGTALASPEDIPGGSVPYLARAGHGPVSYRVELEPRMPSRHEAAVLAIPKGVALAVEYRTGTGPAGPVFVSVTLWPGDRTRLILDL